MTTIISWNIQTGCGVDGTIDLKRIANTIEGIASADIICLQEVACFETGQQENNQFDDLHKLFPKYKAIKGYGIERASNDGFYRFGNMILSRLPVLNIFRHQLPCPPATNVKYMPRQATEITVKTPSGALRVITTHLEFYSQLHRQEQILRLRDLHAEVSSQNNQQGVFQETGPYAPLERPATAIVCGDFNMVVGSEEYLEMLSPFDDGQPDFIDAWPVLYSDRPHDPTCGIFDQQQWPQGAHCRDFYFITSDLTSRLAALNVDQKTEASDHQPMVLILDNTTTREDSD